MGSSLNLNRRRPTALSLNSSLDAGAGPRSVGSEAGGAVGSSSSRSTLLSKGFGLNSPRGVADGGVTRAASTPSPDQSDEFSPDENSGGSNGLGAHGHGGSSRTASRNGESALGRRAAAAREKAGAISGPRATFGVVKKKPVEPERPAWLDDIDARSRAGAFQVAADRGPPRRRRAGTFQARFAEQEQRDGPETHRAQAAAGPEPAFAVEDELGGAD